MVARRWFASLLFLLCASGLAASAQQRSSDDADERASRHDTEEWRQVAAHLPDPNTSTPQALTVAADVLRARRMQEDALDYYRYALVRGGDEATLENDIGVTLLELQRLPEARIAFQRTLKLKPKSARAWNNLGATEYVAGNFRAALADDLRAVKLDKKEAVYHSNLGTAYFELKDFESARSQFRQSVKLNPDVFRGGGWAGVEAHVLSASDHGRFCFEMAVMAAEQHDDANVVRWLARASEAGFDIMGEMGSEKDLNPYRKDAGSAPLPDPPQ